MRDERDEESAPLVPKKETSHSSAWHLAVVVAKASAATIAYIAASAGMIFFNKHLMRPERFPFPAFLTAVHMLVSFVLTSGLRQVAPDLFPSAPDVFGGEKGVNQKLEHLGVFRDLSKRLLPFMPLAACGSIALVGSNGAYRYADVSFLQIVKEANIVWIYSGMVLFGMEVPRLRNCLVLAFVACAAALAVCGANGTSFSLVGLFMQLLAGFAQSMQIVLTNCLMSQRGGPKIDPMTMVLCTAPAMFLALMPANYILWNHEIMGRVVVWWPQLLASACAAFVLQVVSTVTVRLLSATGHALASVLKDLVIVSIAASLLHERLTKFQILGFVGSLSGIALYSAMKLWPPSEPSSKTQQDK